MGRDTQAPERHLRSVDPKLGRIIDEVVRRSGPRRFQSSSVRSHFEALARSIIYQQLSGKAAGTIYGRFALLFSETPTPAALLALPIEQLRAAGVSGGKARFLRALSEHVADGRLSLETFDDAPDEAIIEALTLVPGVGVWTAQMFLMFRLQRPDVLPTGDLGIRKGLQAAHGLKKIAAPRYVDRAGKKWGPWRSIASLYLWSAVDLKLVEP